MSIDDRRRARLRQLVEGLRAAYNSVHACTSSEDSEALFPANEMMHLQEIEHLLLQSVLAARSRA